MSDQFEDLVNYRLERASDALEEAEALANIEHWNACINRLYYACFYAVIALLIKHNLSSSKHSGVRSLFNKEFIKNGVVPKEHSKTYNDLFKMRQESDYEDFYKADEELVYPFMKKTKSFFDFINNLLK